MPSLPWFFLATLACAPSPVPGGDSPALGVQLEEQDGGRAAGAETSSGARPNVILIIADDLKPGVLGFEGDPLVRTPHLDRMAEEGTTFSRAYVPLPQCGPSRAALLVGRYPHEIGALTNPGRWDPSHPSIAQLLGRAGYRTGLIGKWHLTDDATPQAGFDSWCTISREFKTYVDPILWQDGQRRELSGFLPDVLTDLALEFIDDSVAEPAPENEPEPENGAPESERRPFFLWLAYKTPHEPWSKPEGDEFVYERRDIPLPASLEDDLSTKPSVQVEGQCHRAFRGTKNRTLKLALQTYYAMVTSLDANVGRIRGRLEEHGIERETLVIFLSDNGFLTGEHQMFTKGPAFYEELVRTPLLFHWPGAVPAGARHGALASTLDLLPTIVGLAGGEVPDEVRGLDLMPVVRGEELRVRDELFLEYVRKLDEVEPMLGVVTERSKYVRYLRTDEEELYDFASDPHEMTNLAASSEHASELARLRERVAGFRAGIQEPFW